MAHRRRSGPRRAAAGRRATAGSRITPRAATTRHATPGAPTGTCSAPHRTCRSSTKWPAISPIPGNGRRGTPAPSSGRCGTRRTRSAPTDRRAGNFPTPRGSNPHEPPESPFDAAAVARACPVTAPFARVAGAGGMRALAADRAGSRSHGPACPGRRGNVAGRSRPRRGACREGEGTRRPRGRRAAEGDRAAAGATRMPKPTRKPPRPGRRAARPRSQGNSPPLRSPLQSRRCGQLLPHRRPRPRSWCRRAPARDRNHLRP